MFGMQRMVLKMSAVLQSAGLIEGNVSTMLLFLIDSKKWIASSTLFLETVFIVDIIYSLT